MAIPVTGMRIEKMMVGMPAIEAAAGEINADSIVSVFPFGVSYAITVGYVLLWMITHSESKGACISRLSPSSNRLNRFKGSAFRGSEV
jgi:hypothetical protein